MTRLECLGLLISETASIKAVSRSGSSTIWRSIVEPADGWPRVSQLTGTECQVCLIFKSFQGTTTVAKSVSGTVAKKKSTKNQKCDMSTGGQRGMWKLEIKRGSGTLRTWLECRDLWCISPSEPRLKQRAGLGKISEYNRDRAQK